MTSFQYKIIRHANRPEIVMYTGKKKENRKQKLPKRDPGIRLNEDTKASTINIFTKVKESMLR